MFSSKVVLRLGAGALMLTGLTACPGPTSGTPKTESYPGHSYAAVNCTNRLFGSNVYAAVAYDVNANGTWTIHGFTLTDVAANPGGAIALVYKQGTVGADTNASYNFSGSELSAKVVNQFDGMGADFQRTVNVPEAAFLFTSNLAGNTNCDVKW